MPQPPLADVRAQLAEHVCLPLVLDTLDDDREPVARTPRDTLDADDPFEELEPQAIVDAVVDAADVAAAAAADDGKSGNEFAIDLHCRNVVEEAVQLRKAALPNAEVIHRHFHASVPHGIEVPQSDILVVDDPRLSNLDGHQAWRHVPVGQGR
ncbi:MAG: hypothetical protein VR70_04035 [Rhodospirillaceae bacterium BRH_c57]|nr:MAG: hypothetical protein VR70_04035 [Rhodospirillaceae bacterium BRH_c57]